MAENQGKVTTINQAEIQAAELDPQLLAKYREILAKTDAPAEEHELLARLLAFYEIPVKEVKNFLKPEEKASLPKPFALKDIKAATDLVIDRAKEGKKFAVWADYDADGNTSAAMLGHVLKAVGAKDPILTIPKRTEGFGLNIPGIRELHKQGVEVLVVADSGTVAHDQIAEARKLGMEVVVLDHHHPHAGEELPDALVVNPNRNDETSPHGAMAAAAVTYVFSRDLALNLKERGETKTANAIDFDRLKALSAIGVVADVVSLKNSANRYIVTEGLKQLNTRKYPGVNVLKDLYGDRLNSGELTAEDLAFTIGPCINAASRLGEPDLGMKLLMTETEEESAPLAKRIKAANEERKIITQQVFEEADKKAQEYLKENPDANFLMVADEKWHYGVVGIVAGRLKEKYHLPAACGHTYEDENGRHTTYSMRSADNVDFFEHAVTPILDEKLKGVYKIGGHSMAAGMTISEAEEGNVRSFIDAKLKPAVAKAQAEKTVRYLGKLPLEALESASFAQAYQRMEPFGQMMKRPYYLLENVQVRGVRQVGKDKSHLQFSLGADGDDKKEPVRGGVLFSGVGTNMGNVLTSPTRRDEKMDIIAEPFVKNFKGKTSIGFLPIDIANVTRKGEITTDKELETHSSELLDERKKSQTVEQDAVKNLPRKIRDLQDEGNKAAQAALKTLHQSKVAVLDTETTGLEAGNDDPAKAHGLTQVAMITSLHRSNGNYAAREYNQPILPVSPAYFGWKTAQQDAEAQKTTSKVAYDRAAHEYGITADALAVTGLSVERDSLNGPIKTMRSGHRELDAKPFYEIAPALAKMLVEHTPAAYNAPFDMPVLSRHFSDVLDANPEHPEPRLRIPAENWEKWQEEVRAPLQKALKVPKANLDLPGMQQLPENLTNPAHYHCMMYAAMVHKGFSTQQRLQHIAPSQYGVAFEQDDSAHDALADVGPLVYMLADQYKYFGNNLPSLSELWEDVVKQAGAKGKSIADANGDILLELGKDSEGLAKFFKDFQTVGERNPRTKGYVGIRGIEDGEKGDSVALMGRLKSEKEITRGPRKGEIDRTYYRQPRHIGLIKKTLTRNDVASFTKALSVAPFASTSMLDIAVRGAGNKKVVIENIPIGSLRASTPFLKANPDALEANLKLIQRLASEERVGGVVLENDGITLKGHSGRFGQVKFMTPLGDKNLDFDAVADSVQSHLDSLMKVGAIPGVHATAGNPLEAVGTEQGEDGDVSEAPEPVTYVQLGKKNSMLLEVEKDLMESVSRQMGVNVKELPAQMPGGAIVHYDEENKQYLIEGTLENFREIDMPLRDASWMLHRLNSLPGIFSGETEINNEIITLHFQDGVPMETMQILERSHVPFEVQKAQIKIPLGLLLNDPFHWSQEIGKQKDAVQANLKRTNPEPAPAYIQSLHEALLNDTVTYCEFGRDGTLWLADRQNQFMAFDREEPLIVADKNNNIDLDKSHILYIPKMGKVEHPGLRYQLSKISGMERLPANNVRSRENRITFDVPTASALNDTSYSKELRELAQHMQSVHINGVLDELHEITESPDIELPHHDNEKQYMEQAERLVEWVEGREELFDSFNEELDGILDRELEYRFENGQNNIFEDVASLLMMEHTLRTQHNNQNIADSETVDELMNTTREYADELEKLAFKRERVREATVNLQKRMNGFAEGQSARTESLAKSVAAYHMLAMQKTPSTEEAAAHQAKAEKWLAKIYPVDRKLLANLSTVDADQIDTIIAKNEKKIDELIQKSKDSQQPYAAFQMVSQLSGGLNKLQDETRDLNRTLEFSRELIDGAVALDQDGKISQVREVTKLLRDTGISNTLSTLKILEEEGGVKDIRISAEGKVSFDAEVMLKDQPRWSNRLAELAEGKTPGPRNAPYVLYDTSTLLTMLLADEELTDHMNTGMLGFVRDMADLGIETPVLTDMVLAEFLNAPAPLTPEDIFTFDESGKANGFKYKPERMTHVNRLGLPKPYSSAGERLEFLKDLYNTGQAKFVQTNAAKEYISRVRQSSEVQKTMSDHAPEMKPIVNMEDDELKAVLLDDQQDYYKTLERRLRLYKLRNDAGEVSMADALKQLRDEHGRELPIYVRYEGGDVRGRMIQRLNAPEKPYYDALDKQFNPYNVRDKDNRQRDKFDRKSLAALGNGGFQSTGGLFMSLAIMLNEAGAYLAHPDEISANFDNEESAFQWIPGGEDGAYKIGTVQASYARILENAGKRLGTERAYNAIKDVSFSDTEYNVKPENEAATGQVSPLHRHLMSQPVSVLNQMAQRHMLRLSTYFEKVTEKREAHANSAREQLSIVESSMEMLERLHKKLPPEEKKTFVSRFAPPTVDKQAKPKWEERVADDKKAAERKR